MNYIPRLHRTVLISVHSSTFQVRPSVTNFPSSPLPRRLVCVGPDEDRTVTTRLQRDSIKHIKYRKSTYYPSPVGNRKSKLEPNRYNKETKRYTYNPNQTV